MARRSDDDFVKLTHALAEVHRGRQEPALGEDWARQVMRDIRAEAVQPESPTARVVSLVWRGAAVAATVAAVAVVSHWMGIGHSDAEFVALLAEEIENHASFVE